MLSYQVMTKTAHITVTGSCQGRDANRWQINSKKKKGILTQRKTGLLGIKINQVLGGCRLKGGEQNTLGNRGSRVQKGKNQ